MSWTAIVPLNLGGERKTRLAPRFSAEERARLADSMAAHVLGVLRATSAIGRIVVLSPEAPRDGAVEWRRDFGAGLNTELERVLSQEPGNILIVHGDLPLLTSEDVRAMLHAAEHAGIAIAPDRLRAGTNALAMRADRRLPLAFGPASFDRHAKAAGRPPAFVDRAGLSLDIDTGADFDAALGAGWHCKK